VYRQAGTGTKERYIEGRKQGRGRRKHAQSQYFKFRGERDETLQIPVVDQLIALKFSDAIVR